jgi:hypothetical protein
MAHSELLSSSSLSADIDALVLARVKAEITSRAAHAPIKPPLPELTPMQIQAVIRRGKERPWSGRAAYHSDPFRWVADNYGEWIPGLLQSHLKAADPLLHKSFGACVSRQSGLPDWLDVPSRCDAKLRKITDPQERNKLLVGRELSRIGNRIARAVALSVT